MVGEAVRRVSAATAPPIRGAQRVVVAIVLLALMTTTGAWEWTVPVAAAAAATVDVNDAFVMEDGSGKTSAEVSVVLSERQSVAASVRVDTADVTATSPADYAAISQTVEIPAGQMLAIVQVPVVNDSAVEPDERLTVTISEPTNVLLGDNTANVVIVDDEDDPPPPPVCDDGNPYTVDDHDASSGLCTYALRSGADDDGDGVSAAWVGGFDCDDSQASVRPRATEVAGDGVDNDCDGLIDGAPPRDCSDANPYTTDRYNRNKNWCFHTLMTSADLDQDATIGAWVGGPDCNDADPDVHPGAEEVDDGIDNDCDGLDGPFPVTGVSRVAGVGEPWSCPPSASCSALTVDCRGLPSARASLAISLPTTTPRGVLVMFLGSEGTGYYDGDDLFMPELLAEGFVLARVSWLDGWNNTLPDGPFGLSVAACRTATIVEYVHATRYVPLGLSSADGVCGFCVTGNSAGALQSGYLLAEYGLDDILDAVIMTSGPLPAVLPEACLQAPSGSQYGFHRPTIVDNAYGTPKGQQGPCARQDISFSEVWRADSLVQGGEDYVHPTTRISFLIGAEDHTTAGNHAANYRDRLLAAGSPSVSYETIPNAGHGLSVFITNPDAQDAFLQELLFAP